MSGDEMGEGLKKEGGHWRSSETPVSSFFYFTLLYHKYDIASDEGNVVFSLL